MTRLTVMRYVYYLMEIRIKTHAAPIMKGNNDIRFKIDIIIFNFKVREDINGSM